MIDERRLGTVGIVARVILLVLIVIDITLRLVLLFGRH